MAFLVPTPFSDRKTVVLASTQFSTTLAEGQFFILTSTTACYILQGSNPTAAVAANNTYVPPNVPFYIDGGLGAKLAIIRLTVDGEATLTRAKVSP